MNLEHELRNFFLQGRFVDRDYFSILHNDLTVDDNGFDASPGLAVDDLTGRAIERDKGRI